MREVKLVRRVTALHSIHYLLSLWERLISSVPFVRTEKPHRLELFSPRISRAYVQVRRLCPALPCCTAPCSCDC